MSFVNLAFRNITGTLYRSWVIALCALVLSGFTIGVTLIMQGAENSLGLANDRLGADILVVPQGTEQKVESAILMGKPDSVWMPASNLQKISAVDGVAAATPQLYLSTLNNAPCCSVSNMFLVAYDPTTDFTVTPWLKQKTGGGLRLGEAVGGQYIFTPSGEQNILLYGYFITLLANMEPTGTGLDQSMFLTFDTAREIARISVTRAEKPLVIPAESISAVLVKVAIGQDVQAMAVKILQQVPGVTPIPSPNLFQAYRSQLTGLNAILVIVLIGTWLLAAVLISLVFSMAANERRRELGVLRALGATRTFVLQSLLAEAGILAVVGAILGIAISVAAVALLHNTIIKTLGIPFLFPALGSVTVQIGIGLGVALLCVLLAAMLPAIKISRQEPAVAMRE